jgi:HAD superfamily hydrolase (TIGR01509 family)
MRRVPKAIIFDMDGLMIDSEPLWRKSMVSCFQAVGVPITLELCEKTMGLRIDEGIEYWATQYSWNQFLHPKKDLEQKIVSNLIRSIELEGAAMPGLLQILDFLRHKKIACAVASSSSMPIIECVVEKLQVRSFFDVLCSAEKMEFGKPHPAVFLEAAGRLGVRPDDCWVLEDSVTGVVAAKAARMTVLAIPANAHRSDLRFSLADKTLHSLEDVGTLF